MIKRKEKKYYNEERLFNRSFNDLVDDLKKEKKVKKDEALNILFDVVLNTSGIEIKRNDTTEKDNEIFVNLMKDLKVKKLRREE